MLNKANKNRIGNYQFIKTIGKGTFGKVKLSIHLPTKEYVAIKILEKSLIMDKESLERIKKEIKYLKYFNHPHIIQIYEVKEDFRNFYIIMEYITGGELFNYIIKNEKLNEKEASFFFTQLIYGIKEIHRKKICHRDIKPENLLLTDKKIIKIIDFGLSNEYKDYLSSKCGSPCYAAPEMIRGMKYSGVMIDLWACGIILFAMLCGYLPFDDRDNNILFRRILQCKIEFPSEDETFLSNEAKDLIIRILTPNPLKRIKIDEILIHPFLKYGIQEYKNIMKPIFFNQESIIIDYMVNKLKCKNDDNLIFKLLRANRHNEYTTTYKLLRKKIIEGRFNYNYKINTTISPIRYIKLNNNEIKNIHFITKSLRRSLNANNNLNDNIKNRAISTDAPRNNQINEINIGKNKNYNEENALFGLKNNELFINDSIKNKALYQELILKNKNINNFKKDIDTSVSKEKKQIKQKKIVSKTPPRFMINPVTYERITFQNKYNNLNDKKYIYFPNHLIDKKNGLSADRINKKKVLYIPNPLMIKYFGLQNNNLNLKIGVKKGFIISRTPENNIMHKYNLSDDKVTNNITKIKNNYPKDNNIYNNIQQNNNMPYNSQEDTFNNINYKTININDIDKQYKNKIPLDSHSPNEINPINNLQNNFISNNKTELNKKIIYNNEKNKYNTQQYNTLNNEVIKNDNNKNNILNKNLVYNNNILHQNNNNINTIKTERNSRFENDKIKLRNQINNNNIKYTPLTLRDKKNPLNQMEMRYYKDRNKNINFTTENNYFNKNNNNILLNKDKFNNGFKTSLTNLTIPQIKNKLIKICRKYKYKYIIYNDNKYIIFIDEINSFILEIIFEYNNRILKFYHKSGSEAIINENIDKFLNEINNKI